MRVCIRHSQIKTHLADIKIHVHVHYKTFTSETGIHIAQYQHESSIITVPIY